VTHGYRAPLARWLVENGVDADAIEIRFAGEQESDAAGEVEA
jgi:hypothetical protein